MSFFLLIFVVKIIEMSKEKITNLPKFAFCFAILKYQFIIDIH